MACVIRDREVLQDVLDFIESTAGDVWDATTGLAEEAAGALSELGQAVGNVPNELAEFVGDPKAYVTSRLRGVLSEQGLALLAPAVDGLGKVASDALGTVGLRPLVDGIAAVADVVEDVISKLVDYALCAPHAKDPLFWTLTGAVVGARAAGLVDSKADCHALHQAGTLAQLVATAVPPGMLDCAIDIAFEVPLPPPRVTERGPAVPKGTPPIPCAFAEFSREPVPPTRSYFGWALHDLFPELERLWGGGWRIAHLGPYLLGGKPHLDFVLEQTGAHQGWVVDWPLPQFEAKHREVEAGGFRLTSFRSCLGPDGAARAFATWGASDPSRGRQTLVLGKTERWWRFPPKGDSLDPAMYADEALRRPRSVRFVSAYAHGGSEVVFDVVLEDPPSERDVRLGYGMPARQFVEQNAKSWREGFDLATIAPYVRDGRVHVTAVWHRVTRPHVLRADVNDLRAVRSPHLGMWGWPVADVGPQLDALHRDGYRLRSLASYVV